MFHLVWRQTGAATIVSGLAYHQAGRGGFGPQRYKSRMNGCERYLGRPDLERNGPYLGPALDEICLLEIPQACEQFVLKCIITDLNCNKISSISPNGEVSPNHLEPLRYKG